jgi:hypothetical protein
MCLYSWEARVNNVEVLRLKFDYEAALESLAQSETALQEAEEAVRLAVAKKRWLLSSFWAAEDEYLIALDAAAQE